MSEFRISARRWLAILNWHGKSFKSASRSWFGPQADAGQSRARSLKILDYSEGQMECGKVRSRELLSITRFFRILPAGIPLLLH
jgi:hypothetical protein